MIDQSHNLKGKIEAMVQTVVMAQELFAKAALVDQEKLSTLQQSCDLVAAEETLRGAFWTDVRPMVKEWRQARKLPAEPLEALKEERLRGDRSARNAARAMRTAFPATRRSQVTRLRGSTVRWAAAIGGDRTSHFDLPRLLLF